MQLVAIDEQAASGTGCISISSGDYEIMSVASDPFPASFHDCTRAWFAASFERATLVQTQAWPVISSGRNALLLAPTGSGKTLAAFLASIDRIMFGDGGFEKKVHTLYISPLKALGVDVDRNLRTPIAGLRAEAAQIQARYRIPSVAVRSGDTTPSERRTIVRQPPDILITTPESLYLILTSRAAGILDRIETVIVDEIHALAGTKRGTHLFLSLERLERLRLLANSAADPLQRIGLSATQRPLEEIARLLGGGTASHDTAAVVPREVEIIDAGEPKRFELTVETPAEDMANPGGPSEEDDGPSIPSVWASIHPRLVELIRQHSSTMIFVNSRRLAERLAGAINEVAGEEIALAHHGSIAKETRSMIEGRLKNGELPAMIATSSMELGIDMGAVDLVIQIEAPPSIASGTQRIGRAGHQVGAASRGVIFPKYRGDLLACAAAAGAMRDGWVEETQYPRNPLDVLAQQIVAMTSRESMSVDDLFAVIRGAAPFFKLPRRSLEGVLDLLAGRYPSDDFAGLKPRINWDRVNNIVSPRAGSQRVAILNAGTIPDRGLFGVYLVGDGPGGTGGSRVGELDEEMVFETLPGDVFLLGASSWRALEITRDRVLVAPAPGEPGQMPFWRGDRPGRPTEFGRAMGQLARELTDTPAAEARRRLTAQHGLDVAAAENLLAWLNSQIEASGDLPTDKNVVLESFPDEIGDQRIVLLTPFGSRIHAPWATIVAARLRQEIAGRIDFMWTDDGIVFRLPESERPLSPEVFFPDPADVESALIRELGSTALFAGRFRENAARALLLPRRSPGRRTPLWLQRRRSADLLEVAARYREFPILLETYRECLTDVFDVPGLTEILAAIASREIRVRHVQSGAASPFAAAVMFSYAGNFLYDGDAPLAERRAQALALDHTQLRELMGSADLRELLDPGVIDEVSRELRRLNLRLRHGDDLHEALWGLGPLTLEELTARTRPEDVRDGHLQSWLDGLLKQRRVIEVCVADAAVFAAIEDAARLRDALRTQLPDGIPDAFLKPVEDPLGDLISRFARTHGPFTAHAPAHRFGLGLAVVETALEQLQQRGRVSSGAFLPRGETDSEIGEQEWCSVDVLRKLKRRSLDLLRQQVEPVDERVLANFLPGWHSLSRPRRGLDGLLDTVEQLQGLPLSVSTLENEVLSARLAGYRPGDLDQLCLAGEILWRGFGASGEHDGRIGLYLTDQYSLLALTASEDEAPCEIRDLLRTRGALLFSQIKQELGGFPNDLVSRLWQLVWAGEVTNDTIAPLRSRMQRPRSDRSARRSTRTARHAYRSRRTVPALGSEGRWSLLPIADDRGPTQTERQAALARQLIERYGVLTREMLNRERVVGGFLGLYPVLRAMEESGRVRRGYFVSGLGAAQFAAPGAADQLRSARSHDADPEQSPLVLAAVDPANAWGSILKWPSAAHDVRLRRVPGAKVVLWQGHLLGYLLESRNQLTTFDVDEAVPGWRPVLAAALAGVASPGAGVLLAEIDGEEPAMSSLAPHLRQAGFEPGLRGYLHRGYSSV